MQVGDIVVPCDSVALSRYGYGPFRVKELHPHEHGKPMIVVENIDGSTVMRIDGIGLHKSTFKERFVVDHFLNEVYRCK